MSESPNFDENPVRTVSFPAQFESLEDVRAFVAQAAQDCGLEEDAVYAVQMAVDEAFTNIIEHAYGGECQEKIECVCQLSDQALKITLSDCGSSFNPEAVPDPDLEAPLEERVTGGLGLFFMRQLMDEVDFSFAQPGNEERRCNVLTMVKRKEKTP